VEVTSRPVRELRYWPERGVGVPGRNLLVPCLLAIPFTSFPAVDCRASMTHATRVVPAFTQTIRAYAEKAEVFEGHRKWLTNVRTLRKLLSANADRPGRYW
jgi:hypothetical protein